MKGKEMYYSIVCEDVTNSLNKRKSVRPAHLERLNELVEQNRLMIAGPQPAVDSPEPGEAGFSGSLIIAEFDSLEQAESWAQADPYVSAGVFKKVSVKPFKKIF